jgi:hypothetical protein
MYLFCSFILRSDTITWQVQLSQKTLFLAAGTSGRSLEKSERGQRTTEEKRQRRKP